MRGGGGEWDGRWDDGLQCHLWGVADWCRVWDAVPCPLPP